YQPSYGDPVVAGNQFAQFPAGIDREPSSIPTRETVTIFQRWKILLGGFNAQPMGLGGFTISAQHSYDVTGKVLHLGNGDTRRADTLGQTALGRRSFPVQPARQDDTNLSFRADGGHYFVDRLQRVVRDETGRIVAGIPHGNTGPCSTTGDGGPATQANLCVPASVVVGPDGSFYLVEFDARIHRVTPDGVFHTIGGKGRTGPIFSCVPNGVSGPASAA